MSVKITVNGDPTRGTKNGVSESVLVAASKVAAQAKALCPVDTGQLRNSIDFGQIDDQTAFAGSNVEYAVYVEFGTKRMAAQPYLRPAKNILDGADAGEIKDIMNKTMKDAL